MMRGSRDGLDYLCEDEPGLAVFCDFNGVVLEVLCDNLTGTLRPGWLLARLLDEASIEKYLNFLQQVRDRGTAVNWDVNLRTGENVRGIHLAGAAVGDRLLVVGARTRDGVLDLYEEMVRLSNEQTGLLREAIKERVRLEGDREESRDTRLFDEISRLNNDLVTLQRELSRKNAELERLNEEKNHFLGMAAHDLRNPLGRVLTYSEFILDEASPLLGEEHRRFLATIQSSTEFMLQLIDNLLDIARIESGRLQLDLRPIDLADLVRRNVELNDVLASKKHVKVVFRHADNLPPVQADPERLEQVLNNLIGNAVKFSPAERVVEVSLARTEGEVVVSVEDRGAGIAGDEMSKLFKPFSRIRGRPAGQERGSGLGLAIVKRIVQEHGGEVRVKSEMGVGSTFQFSIPVESEGT